MESLPRQPIGYQALIELYDLRVIPHYRASYVSLAGGKRTSMFFLMLTDAEIHEIENIIKSRNFEVWPY